ncbi:hypothetical protein [Streptomyces pseudovenezuelae]|uniref:hypothetical protein n=1 Tax=Streptomyces pseudovenezuelae TaxID=67350 RepID=UPI0036ED6AFC
MSAGVLSVALPLIALLQAVLVEVTTRGLQPLARKFFEREAGQGEKNDLNLPANQEDQDYLLDFMFSLSSLGSAAASTAAALVVNSVIMGIFCGVAFEAGNAAVGWVSIILLMACMVMSFTLMNKIAKGDIRKVNPVGRQPPQKKNPSEELRALARWRHNANAIRLSYLHRMKTLKTLAPYKTTLWGAAVSMLVFKGYL